MDTIANANVNIDIFSSTLIDFGQWFPEEIKYILKENKEEHTFNSPVIQEIIKAFKFKLENMIDMHRLFLKDSWTKAVNEVNNLKEVNKKILQKLKTSKNNTNTPQQLEERVHTEDACTQTDEVMPNQENNSSFDQSLLDNSCCSSVLDNSINLSHDQKQKNIKVIIYHIPENIATKDIVNAIIGNQDESKVQFLKTFKVKEENKLNYVLELPADIAGSLIKARFVNINNIKCSIKRFVRVLRCFNCQAFNHRAKDCVRPRICPWCAENHVEGQCDKQVKCKNCIRNNSHNHNFDINHPAFSKKCESLKYFIMKVRFRLNTKYA